MGVVLHKGDFGVCTHFRFALCCHPEERQRDEPYCTRETLAGALTSVSLFVVILRSDSEGGSFEYYFTKDPSLRSG